MGPHRDADDALPATCEAASIAFTRSKLDGAAADGLPPHQFSRRRILFLRNVAQNAARISEETATGPDALD
jgi:hypothetical protein